ncbi:MAG: adenylate/guanylate cyclase domain-containing protein [Alphaproteobacteria bacterium]
MTTERVERRLAAILAADVVGYSRLMGEDEVGTLRALQTHRRELIEPKETKFHGRTIKLLGDGALMEFGSVVDAVQFAIELQLALHDRNAVLPEERRIAYRIGINLGDIIVDGDDIYGDGVNVAARLEALAEPGGICVRRNVRDEVRDKLDIQFKDMGEVEVKNIARPVHCFAIKLGDDAEKLPPGAPARRAATGRPEKPSVAVLPFDNKGRDAEKDDFADGITEDITTALSRIRGFSVVARSAALAYKGRPLDAQDTAGEPAVRYLLEGSIRRAGSRVRIAVQLTSGETGSQLWAEKYDREMDDVFALQDEITLTVMGALEPELGKAEIARALGQPAENLGAWDHYHLGAAHFHKRSKADMVAARRCFERAIEIDPAFAPAYSGAANVHYYNVVFGYFAASEADRAAAVELAQGAADLDPDDPIASAILGQVSYAANPDRALRALRKSLDLNPSSALTHSLMGTALASVGRFDEAMSHHDEAVRLGRRDPTLPMIMSRRSISHYWAGRFDEAIEWMTQAVSQSNAQLWQYYAFLAASQVQLSQTDAANAAIERMRDIIPNITLTDVRSNAAAFCAANHVDRLVDDLRSAGLAD